MRTNHIFIKICLPIVILLWATSIAEAKMVSISGGKVNLRSGPGTKYAIQWEYGKGFPLRILSSKGNWYKVQDFENDSGWVYKKMVNRTPHLIVKRKRINIRSNPSSRSKLIGKADYGVVFKTLEQKKGWAKVKHENGLSGWVRRDLLWGF